MSNQLFLKAVNETVEPDSDSYYEYFKDSIGKGSGKYYPGIGEVYRSSTRYTKGYGILGIHGELHRGEGLGNIFSSLWRMAFPMIQTGAKKLGSAALDVATNVAADALQGKDIKESAKEHLKAKGSELLQTLNPSLTSKTQIPVEPTISLPQTTSLKAPPPTYRKLPRKRVAVPTKKTRAKAAKYPALKFM